MPLQQRETDSYDRIIWRAGTTWTVQALYRDPHGPGGTGFNFTDALRIEFTP